VTGNDNVKVSRANLRQKWIDLCQTITNMTLSPFHIISSNTFHQRKCVNIRPRNSMNQRTTATAVMKRINMTNAKCQLHMSRLDWLYMSNHRRLIYHQWTAHQWQITLEVK